MRQRVKIGSGAFALVLGALLAFVPVPGAAQEEEYYADKTIRLLIGFGPGGANDGWARNIARHMESHIPGNPTIDLDNPTLQPWVVEALRVQNEEALSGAPIFDGKVRCWPPGLPVFLLRPGSPLFLLQSADEVQILLEPNSEVRRVAMNGPHTDNPTPSWHGESIGHYEGDTLVVDTIGLDDRSFMDNYRTPHSVMLHVVERYRMIDDGAMLEVTVQVEDQGAFTMPWSAMRRFRRDVGRLFTERICAENNEDYFGYDLPPIPQENSPDF